MVPPNETVYRECPSVVDSHSEVEPNQSPAEAIVDAVTAAAEENPLASTPLYEYVDPDAVNMLFDHPGSEKSEVLLRLTIETWVVFVHADGRIRVCDGTKTTEPQPVFE